MSTGTTRSAACPLPGTRRPSTSAAKAMCTSTPDEPPSPAARRGASNPRRAVRRTRQPPQPCGPEDAVAPCGAWASPPRRTQVARCASRRHSSEGAFRVSGAHPLLERRRAPLSPFRVAREIWRAPPARHETTEAPDSAWLREERRDLQGRALSTARSRERRLLRSHVRRPRPLRRRDEAALQATETAPLFPPERAWF